jgi:hypothetical protein
VIFSVDRADFRESLAHVADLSKGSPETEIALLIYPLLDLDRLAFEDFVRRLRNAEEERARSEQAGQSEFAMAAFHPGARPDLSHPDRLVPYIRRSPDPTVQLVRSSVISSIKGLDQGTLFLDLSTLSAAGIQALREARQPKPVRERIAEDNFAKVLEVGPNAIDPVLEDIFLDREAAHARLAERYGDRGPSRLLT